MDIFCAQRSVQQGWWKVDQMKDDGLVDTYPGAVEEDADEHGRDGEVVDEAADLKHEVELVRRRHKLQNSFIVCVRLTCFDIKLSWETGPFVGLISKYFYKNTTSTYPDEKIDHESDIECEVDLLGGVLVVGDAVLDPLGGRIPEINQERYHRKDKHAEDLLEI